MDLPQISQEFHAYARVYDEALEQGIALSGEDKIYFVRRRLEWLKQCQEQIGAEVTLAMEFGCGTGAAAAYLTKLLGADSSLGVDISSKFLELARTRFGSQTRFLTVDQYKPAGEVDVACNGVSHHITPSAKSRGS